jgi:hypothetical protein
VEEETKPLQREPPIMHRTAPSGAMRDTGRGSAVLSTPPTFLVGGRE